MRCDGDSLIVGEINGAMGKAGGKRHRSEARPAYIRVGNLFRAK